MSGGGMNKGVSADKSEVHQAIQNLDKGIFPNAFCKILPDITGGDDAYCNLMHADTAGTKRVWLTFTGKRPATYRFGKASYKMHLAMNLDDMACSGFGQRFYCFVYHWQK